MLKTLKDFDGYSAFITGEKSEVIPLSVGKSILMDEIPNVDSLFVEEASTRHSTIIDRQSCRKTDCSKSNCICTLFT